MSGSVYSGALNSGPGLRAGVSFLNIDGDALDVVGETKYDTTTVVREGLIGQSGPQGFSEMPKYGMIGAKIRDAGNITVQLFNAKTASSVSLQLANGKTVSGDGMFCTKCDPVSTQEATFDVEFMGISVTEQTV
jgi:hypothetical protein